MQIILNPNETPTFGVDRTRAVACEIIDEALAAIISVFGKEQEHHDAWIDALIEQRLDDAGIDLGQQSLGEILAVQRADVEGRRGLRTKGRSGRAGYGGSNKICKGDAGGACRGQLDRAVNVGKVGKMDRKIVLGAQDILKELSIARRGLGVAVIGRMTVD